MVRLALKKQATADLNNHNKKSSCLLVRDEKEVFSARLYLILRIFLFLLNKFIIGFLSGALLFGVIGVYAATSYVANIADFKVIVNGEEFVSDPPALVVEGRTYLPLRAMGDALGVPVNWNEDLRQAEVGNTGKVNGLNTINGDSIVDGITFSQLKITDMGMGGYLRCDVNVTNNTGKDLSGLTFKAVFYDDAGNRVFVSGLGAIASSFKNGETKTVTLPTFVNVDLSKATNVKYEFLFDLDLYEE